MTPRATQILAWQAVNGTLHLSKAEAEDASAMDNFAILCQRNLQATLKTALVDADSLPEPIRLEVWALAQDLLDRTDLRERTPS